MTNAQIVQQYYIAYYGRPADPAGFNFWVGQLDSGAPLTDLIAAFGNPSQPEFAGIYGSDPSAEEFFTVAYNNILNRGVDEAGLDFWVGVYDSMVDGGASPAEARAMLLAEFIKGVEGGSQRDQDTLANKIALAELTTDIAVTLPDSTDANALINFVRDDAFTGNGIATAAEFEAGKAAIEAFHKSQGGAPVNFTLQEAVVIETIEGVIIDPEVTIEVFWGANEGTVGGGVPIAALVGFLGDFLDSRFSLVELLNLDSDVLDSIVDITIAGAEDEVQGGGGIGGDASGSVGGDGNVIGGDGAAGGTGDFTGTYTITVTLDNGNTTSAQVELSAQDYEFINGLLFDADGNSRLYSVQVLTYPQVAIGIDGRPILDGTTNGAILDVDGELILIDLKQYNFPNGEIEIPVPIILTPSQNNGGTLETGFTTAGNDVIVAGRLDLLHQAYIDGGLGVNTLEVDAKGLFAQPLGLFNIQHVKVQNLPNIYTDGSNGSTFPDVAGTQGNDDSVLDLSRAVDIETLTITEGDYFGLDGEEDPGDLTITGIRNGVVTTLDGSFTQDLRLNYGELQGDGVTLVFNNLSMEGGDLEVGHNAEKLTIVSAGGGNFLQDLEGSMRTLVITGDAHLYIEDDLDNAFRDETPVTIDASANTGGVHLRLSDSEDVTFLGSSGNDRFEVDASTSVVIQGNGGNNIYEVDTTTATVVLLDGNNQLFVDAVMANITVGDGDNLIEAQDAESVVITTGDGNNIIDTDDSESVVINTGTGDDVVRSIGSESVTVASAGGDNTITVTAEDITITTGDGNDVITVAGLDDDYTGEDRDGDGALFVIDTGAGSNTVNLGIGAGEGFGRPGTLTAKVGSSITGEDITLVVQTTADLRAASLEGISAIILDDDRFGSSGGPSANDGGGNRAVLTVTDKQMAQFAADGVAISVDGGIFNTSAHIKIIVTENLDVTTGAWAALLSSLPVNVDLQFEINDGATLRITAQQLHTKVAAQGITIADDGNTDVISGKVVITGAGLDFDPFNNSDQVRTIIDSREYVGGSLSTDPDLGFVRAGADLSDGVQRSEWGFNVLVDRVLNGYNRPADAPTYSRLVIDTDEQGPVLGPFATIETFLRIVGDSDMAFTPMAGGIDEWGAPIEGGSAIQLGVDLGNPTNAFMVDFSSATGAITNLTLAHFDNASAMFGNGTGAGADVRVNVEIGGVYNISNTGVAGLNDGIVASSVSGLVSRGVQTYVVTDIDNAADTAEFWTSRVTQDLEVLGLRGNYDATIIFGNTERGVDFLMEVAFDKFDGYSVGTLIGVFARPGAAAVVNVVGLGDLPVGEVQKVAGINLINAATGTVNIEGGNTVIESLEGNIGALVITSADDVEIEGDLPTTLALVDASGVVGEFTAQMSPAGDFSFVGSEGGSTLTLDGGFIATAATTIDGGAAGVQLVIAEGADIDLSAATLVNVTSVLLEDGSTLTLDMTQADEIGPENFLIAPGDTADLELMNLAEEPFALANYADGITVALVGIAPLPVVTLHPDTDLTGIGGLMIPEGTVLNMTAEQFVQLAIGGGAITGEGTVNVTGGTQADFGAALAALAAGATVSMTIDGDVTQGTFELVTDVVLPAFISGTLGEFEYLIGGNTLTLTNVELGDGVTFTGEAGSTLQFTDLDGFLVNIDASGFDVDFLRITDLLVSGNNVDYIFAGLPERVTKVIYNGDGNVEGRVQNVVVEEGTTIFGDISFNEYRLDTEVAFITINLEGGTLIAGDLVLSTVEVNIEDDNLIPGYLQELVINSTGTAGNNVTGNTANVIDGDITPAAYGPAIGVGSRDNNLKSVTINADQDFTVTGRILFSSHGDGDDAPLNNQPEDGITANDDSEAVATLTVTGTANVNAGTLDTSDDDIVALNVVNNGTGTLSATINEANIDADDEFSFTGTGDIALTVVGAVDLSGDDLAAVSQITIAQGATLTLSQAQYDAIGAAGIIDGGPVGGATLNLVEFEGAVPFDATELAAGITVVSITMAAGAQTLDPTTNLTGVGQIIVPEGGTLSLTAAQFQQLAGSGTIVGVDAAGDPSTDITVNITGLTNADVQYDLDGDGYADADDGFDITLIAADNITISLGEAEVTLGELVNGVLVPGSESVVTGAEFILADNETLNLVSSGQANGLVVNGGANTTLVYQFVALIAFPGQINASGYDVTVLKALAASFNTTGLSNVEYSIDDLRSSVELRLVETPEELGFLTPTFRVVSIEEGITTPTGLIFNDWDATDEVRSLVLNLEGDVTLNGDLSFPTRTDKDGGLVQQFFNSLTINSTGADVNTINGDIDTVPPFNVAPNTLENNLLNITINAEQDLTVTGEIVFNHVVVPGSATAEATLTLTGDADVSIKALDTTDASITGLNIINLGTGTLTVTGGSDSLELDNTETLVFEGTGDIVLDTDTGAGNNGIEGNELSLIDASGLSGDLTLGVIEDIDSQDFAFISGTGVTTLTLAEDDLNADVEADPVETGWSFDFSNAAAGSEFHIGDGPGGNAPPTFTMGPLTINLGPNTTLFIDEDTDFTDVDLTIIQTLPIVLADGVTLTLTAAQASDLNIIAGPDTGAPGYTGKVVIDDLGDYPDLNENGSNDDPDELIDYDFSGILVPASATLFDNDVTLSEASILGGVVINLVGLEPGPEDLSGQTIRFATVEQAERTVIVTGQTGIENSSNVVWLFDDALAEPVDTSGYFQLGGTGPYQVGRLWFSEELVAANGGDVESMFTTLPNTILRVDFSDITELDFLLNSEPIDRIIELVAFTDVSGTGLLFSDTERLAHIESLELRLGGEVNVGDLEIDNVVTPLMGVDPASILFDTLTINSYRALHQDHFLAPEGFVNNNIDGNEAGEFAQPNNVNVIGNISVGNNDGLDLLDVAINTGLVSVVDGGLAGALGADVSIQTITFDSGVANEIASVVATGENDVTIKSLDTTDPNIVALVVNTAAHTGVYLVTGGSAAAAVGNTETLTIDNGDAGEVYFGFVLDPLAVPEEYVPNLDGDDVPYAGVAGAELSTLTVSGPGLVNLGTIALIDGTDDDTDGDGIADQDAFTLNGGGVMTTFARLGEGNVDGVLVAPTLEAEQTWVFNDVNLTITEDVTFEADSNLTLNVVDLTIEGDVDLTEVNLDFTDVDIFVPAGQSLTLTLDQIDEANSITGEGTVFVTGEVDTDDPVALDLSNIQTAGVDLSGITNVGVIVPQAEPVIIQLSGAVDDAGAPVGQNVVGTPFDDIINMDGSPGDGLVATVRGGAGDDTINLGSFATVFVDEGTDTIEGLFTDGSDPSLGGDTLVVSSGAVANANSGRFVATADTINDGEANLTLFDFGLGLLDVSLAGGANGFTLLGAATGSNTLIGSEQDDVINGGNDEQQNPADRDFLTGNGGEDLFVFDILVSEPVTLTAETTTPGEDNEIIEITPFTNDVNGDQVLTITFRNNDLTASFVISNDASVDFSDVTSLGNRIATDLTTRGLSTVFEAGELLVTGAPGQSVEINNIVATGGDIAGFTRTFVEGVDVPQVTVVTVGNGGAVTAVAGEIYAITVSPAQGGPVSAEFEAVGGETLADIAAGLFAELNPLLVGDIVATHNPGEAFITLAVDPPAAADRGGFTVTLSSSGGVESTGASQLLDGTAGDLLSADVITDFNQNGNDSISLGLAAGTAGVSGNYDFDVEQASYADAFTVADSALGGNVVYFFTSILADAAYATATDGVEEGDTLGLLFFDANNDGDPDGVIVLLGVDETMFSATDLVA